MAAEQSTRTSNGSFTPQTNVGDNVAPDYEAWDDIQEVSSSIVVRCIDFLSRRTIHEIAIIIGQAGTFLLAWNILRLKGAGMTPTQEFVCVLSLSAMGAGPALYHTLLVGKQNNAQNIEGGEDSTQPRNERGSSQQTRNSSQKNGCRQPRRSG